MTLTEYKNKTSVLIMNVVNKMTDSTNYYLKCEILKQQIPNGDYYAEEYGLKEFSELYNEVEKILTIAIKN